MSEPYGNKWKQYKVWPSVLGQSGNTVDKLKLNIGDPSSLQGVQGPQGIVGEDGGVGVQGVQGPNGNPSMQLTSPNGTVYEIEVDNIGQLSTTLIYTPPPQEDQSEGPGESNG